LIEQGPRRYLGYDETGRGRLLMRPDIALLYPDGRPTMILDTKWKRLEGGEPMAALSPADLYQMSSYASAYRCEHVSLLYPEQEALPARQSHLLQLTGAETAKLTIQSVGFGPDGSLLPPLVNLIDTGRRLGNVNMQPNSARANARSNDRLVNQRRSVEAGIIVSGDGWWLEIGSVNLDRQLVTIQQGGSLLVAIASRDDGRLRAAIYQPLDARSIEILLGLAVNPHPETGDVKFRETNWEYALDSASGMRHAYANQRGESYLSYWAHGLGIGSDGETIPAWHKQRNLSSRPAELVAKELMHFGGLSDGMPDVPQRCANSDESDGGSLATDQLPGWESKPQQVKEAQGRFLGCMLGGAVGDALGAPVEFLSRTQILEQFGPEGLRDYAPAYGRTGAITDDTQMSLFTAEGLLRAHVRGCTKGITSYQGVTANAYLRWLQTQSETPFTGEKADIGDSGWLIQQLDLHHRRAPGATCVSALRAMRNLGDPAINDSKGCGGVMRVAPVGLYLWRKANVPQAAAEQAFELGAELAAITHGHPTGKLTAGVLAVLVLALADGACLGEALETAKAILQRHDNHKETLDSIELAERLAASNNTKPAEAIAQMGQGWIAEEALAIAIYCSLVAPSFDAGVLMAVNHDGDSDSTGAITGNLLGAMYGLRSIPTTWLESLELRDVITEVANDLYECWTWKIDGYSTNEEQTELIWEKYPGC
jgi:ADP-ribosylglycohydrolase